MVWRHACDGEVSLSQRTSRTVDCIPTYLNHLHPSSYDAYSHPGAASLARDDAMTVTNESRASEHKNWRFVIWDLQNVHK
jgi:hypothetical protein